MTEMRKVKQLWEYGVEELAERCALAENEIERLRAELSEWKELTDIAALRAERDGLLAALKEIAEYNGQHWASVREFARAAIVKAEGK